MRMIIKLPDNIVFHDECDDLTFDILQKDHRDLEFIDIRDGVLIHHPQDQSSAFDQMMEYTIVVDYDSIPALMKLLYAVHKNHKNENGLSIGSDYIEVDMASW